MDEVSGPGTIEPLDALLEAAVDAIVLIDQLGAILRFNPAAEAMFGVAETEVLGRNVNTLMPEPFHSQHDQFLRRYRDGGPAAIIGVGREVTGLKANGETFPIHLSVGRVSDGDGIKFVGIIRDLSVEKATQETVRELETHLAHADRLVMLGELTAGIAHEISQPLTAIAAYADAGGRFLRSGAPETHEDLENICLRVAEQARRAGDVVTRLRLLSRKETLTKSEHDPASLVSNVLMLFEHELHNAHIELKAENEPGLPVMLVDEIQLQQVMVNLIKNSIDALKTAGTPEPRIHIHMGHSGGHLALTVRDNGPGVPVELEKRLFEPFFTTKLRGVGLGLSICKNIAIAHGGNLRYERSADGGALFTLSLPLDYIG